MSGTGRSGEVANREWSIEDKTFREAKREASYGLYIGLF